MASVTLAQALRMSRSPLTKDFVEEILTVNGGLWNFINWEEVPGGQKIYNRQLTAAGVKWHGVGDTSARVQGTVTTITANVYAMESVAEVERQLMVIYNQPNDPMAMAVRMKFLAMMDEFAKKFVMGNNTTRPNEPDGLRVLTTHYVADASTAGGGISCKKLDDMLALLTASSGRVDFITCGVREINNLRKIKRMLGGADWNTIQIPNPVDPNRPLNLMTYCGIPIIRNDFITATETLGGPATKARVYAVNSQPGIGLVGLRPPGIDNMIAVGGELEDKADPSIGRRCWLFAGLANYSTYALAGLKNITNAALTT